jgi:hypothetical protein
VNKTATVGISLWVDEDEFRRIVDEVVKRLEGRVPVEELRRRLGIRPGDLVEDLDEADMEALKTQDKPPLRTGHKALR